MVQTEQCLDNAVFRQRSVQTTQCSDNAVFRQRSVQTTHSSVSVVTLPLQPGQQVFGSHRCGAGIAVGRFDAELQPCLVGEGQKWAMPPPTAWGQAQRS